MLAAVAADAPLEVVRALLDDCPASIRARTQDRFEEIALHLAFREFDARGLRRPRPDVIRLLVTTWPDSVRVRAHSGWLPLHCAVKLMYEFGCEDRDVLSIVRCLVEAWPGAVIERFEKGTTALHHLLRSRRDVTRHAVELLVEACPAAVDVQDEDGCVPLHHAATKDTVPLDVVRYLVQRRQTSLRARSSEGQLPLYFAAVSSVDKVQFLASAWPPALQESNMHGCLVLHAAAATNAPVAMIELLLRLWWDAVQHKNNEGKLPLHLAAEGTSRENVQRLVEAWRDSVKDQDMVGDLPVHAALRSNDVHLPTVTYLVEQHPESLQVRNADGLLPVQLALSSRCSKEAVEFLLQQRPESVEEMDADGRNLLHYLSDLPHPASTAVDDRYAYLKLLVEHGPGAAGVRDKQGRLPIQVAVANGASPAVVYFLLRHTPDIVSSGRTPRLPSPLAGSNKRARIGYK